MAITLDAVSLPDLVFENEFGKTLVDAIVAKALDGTPIVWEQESQGASLDLIGGDDFGWMDRDTLLDLQARAAVPRSTYVLSYEGVDRTVRFRHEDPPVIEAEPILPRPNAASTDWYQNVRIRLMEV